MIAAAITWIGPVVLAITYKLLQAWIDEVPDPRLAMPAAPLPAETPAPHPSEAQDKKPNDAVLFDLLAVWVPNEAARHRVLVENPASLYDFPASA